MCALCDPLVVDQRIQHPFVLKVGTNMECATCDRHVSVHPDRIDALLKRRAVPAA